VAIRSNHRVWRIIDSEFKYSDLQIFKRVFSDLNSENRYIREIIYSVGGLPALLKTGKSTGRHRVSPKAVIARLSEKLSEKLCN